MGNDTPERFDEREIRACKEACRHVAEGWAATRPDRPGGIGGRFEVPGNEEGFAAFVHAATRLCTLESLAHRTAEVEEDLRAARASFEEAVSTVMAALPERFPRASLRLFAGLAAAQREWLEESGWLEAGTGDRLDWLGESPSRSWACFEPPDGDLGAT